MLIKHKKLIVKKGNTFLHYVCTHCKWNYWLNRYYPKAELIMVVEKLNG